MRTAFLAGAILLGILGCESRQSASPPSTTPAATPTFRDLTFRDAEGGVVATASIALPEKLPAVGQTFKGPWSLISSTPAFPAGATSNGTYVGNVYDEWIAVDLNPGVADNNVVFHWSPASQSINGPWRYATFAGGKEMGTFTITTPPGNVR